LAPTGRFDANRSGYFVLRKQRRPVCCCADKCRLLTILPNARRGQSAKPCHP